MNIDTSTSFWLRAAIADAFSRDIVDALHDAEALVAILQARLDGITASAGAQS